MANLLNNVMDEAKEISNLGMISPDSPLRKQIELALKPKVKLTKKQRPKIIIVEETKKTRKSKSTVAAVKEKPKPESPKPKKTRKKQIPVFKPEKPIKTVKSKKELIVNYSKSPEHKLEGIGKIQEPIEEIIIIPKSKSKVSKKRNLKIPQQTQVIMSEQPGKKYNEEFIDILDKLSNIMLKQGEPFRARAYQKAQETIMSYPENITNPSQLKGLPGIGDTIMEKLNEYVQTGTLAVLEREKTNPVNILADVYGIGPKKAKELVEKGITTIEQLRDRQDELLNDIQKVGLKYYEQILERIPRSEIEEYKQIFNSAFSKDPNSKFEIVGSYRRGSEASGDIDVIITSSSATVYKSFIDELIKQKVIINVLSRGLSKTLVIAKLPGNRVARRVDFLYSPPEEFAFAILYFTGSKAFNTVMRQKAVDQGYTLNEHGISLMENKIKGQKIDQPFENEKAIFDFLKLEYKTPIERKDGRAVMAANVGKMMPAIEPTVVKVAIPDVQAVTESHELQPTLVKAQPPEKEKKKITRKKKPAVELVLVEEPNAKVEASVATKAIQQINEEISPEIVVNLNRFKHEGISVLEPLNEKMLTDMIRFSNKVYYNSEQPILTDNQYDIVKEYTNKKFPSNAAITEIGAEVLRNKSQLPYEMASMEKIKPDTGALSEWSKKYKGPYVLSCKLDGVSGLYTTEGAQPKLYTRGNGIVGQDISYLIPHLKLPKTQGLAIRGEFIIPKTIFEDKYKDKFANPRNMVAGIINHKTINETIKDIHFVAYETIIPASLEPSKQMEFLGTVNVERVLYKMETSLTNELLSELLVDWRTNYIYEIDGVIVTNDAVYPRTSGNPDHAFAFKMVLSDQMAEAKVVDVIWTPSKDGLLKPRVQIEPIHLGGVQIEYATGFNGAFILNNKVGIGATIELIRSGDVIPHIRAVTVPAPEAKMPLVPYVWNSTHIDIMLENAAEDPIVKEKNITGFFKGIEVDGLGAGNVVKIIGAGYDTVSKIIQMSEEDFLKVEGFQKKMASKIFTGIKDKLEKASLVTIMSSSNVFGHGFSEARLTLIMDAEPGILLSKEPSETKIKKLTEIKGMAAKTASAFVEKIPDFVEFLKNTGLESKISSVSTPKVTPIAINHPFNGKTIIVTGLTEKVIEDKVKAVGAKFGSSVSKNTDILVAKSVTESSGKLDKARELNKTLTKQIQIMSLDEFLALV
uniref:DNA polymerase beta n=1 Tax=viral metagenome TaxID=1070528 RepID=A0A6C0I8D9_9ZZZZ